MKIIPKYEKLHSGEHLTRVLGIDFRELSGEFTLRLAFVTPSGQIFVSDELPHSEGTADYELPSSLLDGRGELVCQAAAYLADGKVIKSDCTRLPVKESVDDMSCPEVSAESVKSLNDIFDMIEKKADAEHTHEGFVTVSELSSSLSAKSDTEHTHEEYALKSDFPHIPENISAFKNDAGFINEEKLNSALSEKSDTGHTHDDYALKGELPRVPESISQLRNDAGYVTGEEMNASLLSKSDAGHIHSFDELENKPGDVEYSSEIFNFNSLPAANKSFEHGGYVIDFEHNVKKVPWEAILYLTYRLPVSDKPEMFTGILYYGNSEPKGEIFFTQNFYSEYAEFYSAGFPEDAGDDAFVIHIKLDGTGQIITKNPLTGSKISLAGPAYISEKWVTLPSSAVESTWEATKSDNRLITSGGVHRTLNSHNTEVNAHQDIRILLSELGERINAIADSDDTTLDQLSEIVSYIKNNKDLIDAVTTQKISYSDIVTNLETNVENKPLSASMGVMLKALIDAVVVPTKVSELSNDMNFVTSSVLESKLTEKQDRLAQYVSTVNGKSGTVSLTHSDVGALSDETFVPTKISDLVNDTGYVKEAEIEDALAKVKNTFIVTAAANLTTGELTNLSHDLSDVRAAYERGDHILLNLDVEQVAAGAKVTIPLVMIDSTGVSFHTVVYMGNITHVVAGINDNRSYLLMTPIISQEQLDTRLGGLTFAASSTAPTVDDENVITFADEG